jgi:TolB-like protein
MEIERARYARNVGKALEALANDAHQSGKPDEALEWWHRYSRLAPDGSRVATEVMRVLDADQLAKRRDVVASLSPRCNSIAVLPFNNVTGSDEHAHLADAVSEELMYALTRTPGLHVASRTSAFAYRGSRLDVREVARRLRVAWILEGSVRRSGRTLRVAAQLTDGSNGYQVWSDSVDRISTDDHPIEAEIAGDILRPARRGGRKEVRGQLRQDGRLTERFLIAKGRVRQRDHSSTTMLYIINCGRCHRAGPGGGNTPSRCAPSAAIARWDVRL